MGEHQPDQQRLLLAGRGAARLALLGAMQYDEIAGLRPDQGASGGGVAGAIVAQQGAVESSASSAGRSAIRRSISPSSAMSAQGKGEFVVASGGDHRGEPLHGLAASGGDGDGQFGDFALGGVEPDLFAAPFLQQAVAVAQGFFQRRDAGAVVAVHRQHQPVEKAPTFAR